MPAEDIQEQHALNCFYQWTIKCFPPELIAPFQYPGILHEPALKHAMAALGLLHEIYRHKITGKLQVQKSMIAFQHYDKAINLLLTRQHPDLNEDGISVTLRACFLFVCLEAAQGHHKSALSHLQTGFKLFQELKTERLSNNKNNPANYFEESTIRSLFVRLLCQLTNFDSSDCARFFGLPNIASGVIPQSFVDHDQAQTSLFAITEKIIHKRSLWMCNFNHISTTVNKKEPQPMNKDAISCLADEILELDRWILAFNLYLSHGIPVSRICDSYVLGICGFFLKFRTTMEYRRHLMNDMGKPLDIDFSHIASLGEILVNEDKTLSMYRGKPTVDVNGDRKEIQCPLHRLFVDRDMPQPTSDKEPSSGVCFQSDGPFLFLAIL
ncbi:hypothetical protein BGW36DRAFT_426912 [Talaromyces proteolyticus]|uniref:Uncharacterized protein n=1 Tax=Talaromyces proteolyticus TaxID=1131652 RepID=A0AAD4KTZ1_9EURO|nr:uncharacterized protein BGW36DRAFT_426912 [Talaromyces proteolyticus]KAH8699241.1 hypothetical protein BGW36DRAFT_426912 [Talaromyces proteolyticus]